MIDRRSRDQMCVAIRDYMAERTSAFELDDVLDRLACDTEDGTVKFVMKEIWFHYDDCKDHKIVATKQVWGYFNRLLLLLESDAEAEFVKTRTPWGAEQTVAWLCLAAFATVALISGFGRPLFICTMCLGLVSILLAWYSSSWREQPSSIQIALAPFPSISALLSIRRRVNKFNRTRYPRSIFGRRIRSRLVGGLMWIPAVGLWLILSPAVLLLQALPFRQREPHFKMPKP